MLLAGASVNCGGAEDARYYTTSIRICTIGITLDKAIGGRIIWQISRI
jgi:hypothetical protein